MSTSIKQLADFVTRQQPLTVITGAGCSVSSGIPTYRDDHGTWQRTTPIQHGEFMALASKRQRYWARSYTGWPYVQRAKPNQSHLALAKLEQLGYVRLLVTQNVDRLHQQAGHNKVIDLHGRLDQVHCTDCYAELTRSDMQLELRKLNPHLDTPLTTGEIAPDGDADVPDHIIERMVIPDCSRCGGVLKPSVVFYGGGVDKTVVNEIYAAITQSAGLLVVGSSLMVFSSFRFCRFAEKNEVPLAILNPGKTRADDLASLKLCEPGDTVLPELVRLLEAT